MNAKLTDNAIDIATIGETIYVLEVKKVMSLFVARKSLSLFLLIEFLINDQDIYVKSKTKSNSRTT